MKGIKKELPVFLVILILGCLFILCACARAEQIDKYNEEIKSSYIANN